jgi:cell wall-associated NlpC family hydrolase
MDLKYENLLGKEWVLNEQDCFTMARDFYAQNFPDIEIPDVARPIGWDADKLDLIKMMYAKAGFQIADDDWNELRPADVLCMAIHTSNANHLGIYIGDNEVIHHRFGINSCKETLRPFWRMSTMYILRHPDVPDLRPELPTTSLEEILRGRFRL